MTTSNRGRLVPPNLDDRVWQDLVDQARALIPKYAPQWTDHNPSDVGMTLVELFAWLVEGLTYRLNQVPDKNYDAFLALLGITRDPQTPARAFLTFSTAPGGAPIAVPKGKQAQTHGSETEAPIVFETDAALTVLPTNMKVALSIGKAIFNKYANVSTSFTVPPALGDTVTIAVGQSKQLCFGFDQRSAAELRLLIRLFQPVLAPAGVAQATVDWHYSQGSVEPTSWPAIPTVTDETGGLQREGVARLTVPLDWAAQAPTAWTTVGASSPADTVSDALFWVSVRIHNLTTIPLAIGFNWVLFNAVSSYNALTIPTPEALGTSDGSAFQIFPLKHQPLFKRLDTDTPYDHLVVQVDGVIWAQVDELPAGAGNVYRVNPVSGEVSFGNHDAAASTGNGTVPVTGAVIVATAYRYAVGGTSGLVGAGAVSSLRTTVVGIVDVNNLFASYGASDEEPIEDTKRRAPEVLRIRDRAVSAEDYEYLASEATTDIAIVRCLEPMIHGSAVDDPGPWNPGDPWTFAGIDRSPGNVTVIVVPDGPEPRPQPVPELLREVQRYLDKRRDVTARLALTGPRYLPVQVQVTGNAWKKAVAAGYIQTAADVSVDVTNRIRAFLHPTRGGPGGKGWQVGQNLYISDLFLAIMPAENVGFISTIQVQPENPPPYHDPTLGAGLVTGERPFSLGTWSASVRVADYELVCCSTSAVTVTFTLL